MILTASTRDKLRKPKPTPVGAVRAAGWLRTHQRKAKAPGRRAE
jgi:hypothetical protein